MEHTRTKGFVFLLFSSASLALVASQNDSRSSIESLWELYEPGKLLQTLDSMTADAKIAHVATTKPPDKLPSTAPTTPPKLQRRIQKLEPRNSYSTEDHLNSAASREHDYDRAYEEFVRHYFGKSAADGNAEASDEEARFSAERENQQFEGEFFSNEEELEEPQTEASKIKSKAKQHCKKMRKNRQICVTCKNPKNGEKSETCSYSTETEPQRYSYAKKTNYKEHRSAGGDDSDDGTDEDVDAESTENYSRVKGRNYSRTNRSKQEGSLPSSFCIKKMLGSKSCYHCKDTDGEEKTKCFDQHINRRRSQVGKDGAAAGAGENKRNTQKTQQRIYKRTVSYFYEKGGAKDNINARDTAANDTIRAPHRKGVQETPPRLKRKVVIKVLKQQKSTSN